MFNTQVTQETIYLKYEPPKYEGKAPDPKPRCTEKLPWEVYVENLKKQEELRSKKEKEAEQKRVEQEKKGGVDSFMGKTQEVFTKVSNTFGNEIDTIEKQVFEKVWKSQEKRFYESLETLKDSPMDQKLYFEYTCSVLSGDVAMNGKLYITNKMVSFHFHSGASRMSFFIPLNDIVSFQRAICLKRKTNKHPFIQPVDDEDVQTDAIIIYTKDNSQHCFYEFKSVHDPITPLHEHAWNVLDHAWNQKSEL